MMTADLRGCPSVRHRRPILFARFLGGPVPFSFRLAVSDGGAQRGAAKMPHGIVVYPILILMHVKVEIATDPLSSVMSGLDPPDFKG